jgi:hypothetical protein
MWNMTGVLLKPISWKNELTLMTFRVAAVHPAIIPHRNAHIETRRGEDCSIRKKAG